MHDLKELAFDLVAKTHGLYVGGHEFEIQMEEIICCNNKGIEFEDLIFIFFLIFRKKIRKI